jgi:CDP-glucose 4,6-dehydratase
MNRNFLFNKKFWNKKKVFITGHTGFKGSWLSFYLLKLNSSICGYSLKPNNNDFIFNNSNLKNNITNYHGDIRDYDYLHKCISQFKPDILFHLAAQPIVLDSYIISKFTFETNFNGTLNVLESVKKNKIKSTIIITTDKVYKNDNKFNQKFSEKDVLGGSDPYSTSKVTAENLVECYYNNYFKDLKIGLASARAGNVIGGGDRGQYRIIPDFFRSFKEKKNLFVRSPKSIRPWQHVLEPLTGYLKLAEFYYKKNSKHGYAWNFSSDKIKSQNVKSITTYLSKSFNKKVTYSNNKIDKKEKKYLDLSSKKSNKILNWSCVYNLKQTLDKIIEWEKFVLKSKKCDSICNKQIDEYLNNFKL